MTAHGLAFALDPETSARRFWTIAIGVTLEGQAMGRSPDDLAAEMLRLLGPQADAPPAAARLTVVKTGSSASRQLVRRQGETAMTALRIRARDLMTEQELIEVRTRSTWKSVALIAHAWTLILGSIAMVAVWPKPPHLRAGGCDYRLAPARIGDS